ncbi:phage minor capsid protein [Yeguia hominis]|uniref:ADP ribosyltransferase domain-containing protein n=1 Tax=Yeguia hominis TaxID=2763662 RepID=A0A926HRU2_9FIRM|nr:phage minor capsid protein [Yeguia hominis]MBC8534139.1 hypothetical protein [Yeguia hominis]
MATEEFLRKGIDCIEYKDGKRVNIASYVQMALRTAATRSYLQGEAKGRDELGIDTVLVSQYGACSNTCLPWQGRVYIDNVWGSWNGEREGDRGKSRDGNWYVLLSVAVKNGLFHPNCRHTLSTWISGISTMPEPMDKDKIRKTAALEQKQRKLERDVRLWKRMEAGAVDPENQKQARDHRRTAQKKLREFIVAHDDVLRRDYWREKVYTAPQKDDIIKTLTEQVKALDPSLQLALTNYTGFNATRINQALNGTIKRSETINKSIDQLDLALASGVIPEEITVYRQTIPRNVNVIRNLMNKNRFDLNESTLNKLIGLVDVQYGYLSTSLIPLNLPGRNVRLILRVPKGFVGAQYIAPIATLKYRWQEEILFKTGLRYIITKAKKEGDQITIWGIIL